MIIDENASCVQWVDIQIGWIKECADEIFFEKDEAVVCWVSICDLYQGILNIL